MLSAEENIACICILFIPPSLVWNGKNCIKLYIRSESIVWFGSRFFYMWYCLDVFYDNLLYLKCNFNNYFLCLTTIVVAYGQMMVPGNGSYPFFNGRLWHLSSLFEAPYKCYTINNNVFLADFLFKSSLLTQSVQMSGEFTMCQCLDPFTF